MDTFAPEFSRFWLPSRNSDGTPRDRDDADAEAKALEELAERVSAARSIV